MQISLLKLAIHSSKIETMTLFLRYIYQACVNEITLFDIISNDIDDNADQVQFEIKKSKTYQNLSILEDREKEVVITNYFLGRSRLTFRYSRTSAGSCH